MNLVRGLADSPVPFLITRTSLSSQTSELGVTEHVEGDPCKFALWVGRTPTSDNKIVLKVKHTSSHLLHLLKSCLGFDRYGNLEITGGLKVLKPKITGLIINMSPDKLSYLSDLRKKKAK